jgi:hypothetical protein
MLPTIAFIQVPRIDVARKGRDGGDAARHIRAGVLAGGSAAIRGAHATGGNRRILARRGQQVGTLGRRGEPCTGRRATMRWTSRSGTVAMWRQAALLECDHVPFLRMGGRGRAGAGDGAGAAPTASSSSPGATGIRGGAGVRWPHAPAQRFRKSAGHRRHRLQQRREQRAPEVVRHEHRVERRPRKRPRARPRDRRRCGAPRSRARRAGRAARRRSRWR